MDPEQLAREIDGERNLMHSRMTTPAGHYMIHMALCRLSEPQQMHVSFPDADADAVELMQTLDIRVVELIASTPIVDE